MPELSDREVFAANMEKHSKHKTLERLDSGRKSYYTEEQELYQ